ERRHHLTRAGAGRARSVRRLGCPDAGRPAATSADHDLRRGRHRCRARPARRAARDGIDDTARGHGRLLPRRQRRGRPPVRQRLRAPAGTPRPRQAPPLPRLAELPAHAAVPVHGRCDGHRYARHAHRRRSLVERRLRERPEGRDRDAAVHDRLRRRHRHARAERLAHGAGPLHEPHGERRSVREQLLAAEQQRLLWAGAPLGLLQPPLQPEPDAGFTELGAFGGSRQNIDSDYFFPDIKAGNDIAVYHVPVTPPETFGSVITLTLSTDVDALIAGTGISATPDGVGKIDLFTNGDIVDVELNGDLRAGQIISTANDVTLFSPQAVLDAQNGTGTLGTDPTPT